MPWIFLDKTNCALWLILQINWYNFCKWIEIEFIGALVVLFSGTCILYFYPIFDRLICGFVLLSVSLLVQWCGLVNKNSRGSSSSCVCC